MSARPDISPCRGCRQPVRWVRMPSGKFNPLNVAPDLEKGNVLVDGTGQRGEVLPELEAAFKRASGEPLYLSHFATCERSNDFRKAKAKDQSRENAA